MVFEKYKNLDIFGGKFTINITKKEKSYKTNCGATFTLICFFITTLALYIFVTNYYDTTNPKVTISSEITNKYPEIDLLESEFFPVLTFMNLTKLLTASELSNITTIIIYKREFGVDPNTLEIFSQIVGKMNFVDCRIAGIEKSLMDRIIEKGNVKIYYDLGYALCPENFDDPNFWKIKGSGTELPFSYLFFNLFPCSLEDPNHCLSLNEFMLMDVRLTTISETYKLSEKENPIELLYMADRLIFGLEPRAVQQIHLNFKNIQIMNEDKDFSNSKMASNFYAIDDTFSYFKSRDGSTYCSKEQIEKSICLPYIQIQIKSGPKVETVLRVYPKVLSMISELGGFGDLTFIIVGFIYLFYNSFFFEKWFGKNLLKDRDDETLLKIVKENINEKLSQEEIDQKKEEFFNEKRNGLHLIKSSNLCEAISDSLMSKEHRKVLEFIPLVQMFQSENNLNNRRNIEEITLEECLEKVMNTEPKTDFERIVKEKIENIFTKEGPTKILMSEPGSQRNLKTQKFLGGKKVKSNGLMNKIKPVKISRSRPISFRDSKKLENFQKSRRMLSVKDFKTGKFGDLLDE